MTSILLLLMLHLFGTSSSLQKMRLKRALRVDNVLNGANKERRVVGYATSSRMSISLSSSTQPYLWSIEFNKRTDLHKLKLENIRARQRERGKGT